jgi:hypothetical protein
MRLPNVESLQIACDRTIADGTTLMDELLTLKSLLLQGNMKGALILVDELEAMSRDDKINAISSDAIDLLVCLIHQQVENRTTRLWDVSIRNAVRQIQRRNKRRRTDSVYLEAKELRLALEDGYLEAIDTASLKVANGLYETDELEQLVDKTEILDRAYALITQKTRPLAD